MQTRTHRQLVPEQQGRDTDHHAGDQNGRNHQTVKHAAKAASDGIHQYRRCGSNRHGNRGHCDRHDQRVAKGDPDAFVVPQVDEPAIRPTLPRKHGRQLAVIERSPRHHQQRDQQIGQKQTHIEVEQEITIGFHPAPYFAISESLTPNSRIIRLTNKVQTISSIKANAAPVFQS